MDEEIRDLKAKLFDIDQEKLRISQVYNTNMQALSNLLQQRAKEQKLNDG